MKTERKHVVACPIPPPGEGTGHFSSLYEHTELLRGVVGPISTPNDYQNTGLDDVVNQRGSCRNNMKQEALSRSPREKLPLVAVLCLPQKSLSLLQERNMLFVDRPVKIETYSLTSFRGF